MPNSLRAANRPKNPNRITVSKAYQPLYNTHVSQYKNHSCCDLCSLRHRACLVRGRIPCDVLYIGEAPGDSEDVEGFPFVGPAGALLDEIIWLAERRSLLQDDSSIPEDYQFRRDEPSPLGIYHAFGNLVACIPKDENGKIRQPNSKEIKACQPRLLDLIHICQPRVIVQVGLISQKHVPGLSLIPTPNRITQYIDIVHPSSILRNMKEDPQGAGQAYKLTLLTLAQTFSHFSIPF